MRGKTRRTVAGRILGLGLCWLLLSAVAPTAYAEPDASSGSDSGKPRAVRPVAVKTLEDIYGDSGNSFQAALGILNFEKESSSDPDPAVGFGLSVDDHVIEWREYTLVTDATDCATGGSCATLDAQVSNLFEGNTAVEITLYDTTSPYGTEGVNNCNGDRVCSLATGVECLVDEDCGVGQGTCEFDYSDAEDDQDCDNDSDLDVVVLAQTDQEPAGELVVLNATGVAGEYKGTLPVSATYDVDGVLFAQRIGTTNPVITITYEDRNDGTGVVCQNDIDPEAVGKVQTFVAVSLIPGNVVVINTVLSDNGDDDGFADTGEVVDMKIRVSNKTGIDLTGVTARLASNDPDIDCITNSLLVIGAIPSEDPPGSGTGTVLSAEAFTFRVKDTADRTGLGLTDLDDLSADFSILLFADQFDGSLSPQNVTLDLDLDAQTGSGPTSYFESFEAASGFGSFTTMNLDAGQAIPGSAFIASDGYRCQYSNPDWVNSNSYEQIDDCFVGATASQADRFHWQVHQTDDIDGGRAFDQNQSLYFGIFSSSAADEHTTPPSVLEAVRLNNPVNLNVGLCWVVTDTGCLTDEDCTGSETCLDDFCSEPVAPAEACALTADCTPQTPPDSAKCVGVSSDLTFKHQISLMDSRTVNAPFNESADRGVVAIQLADTIANGSGGVGDWIKLNPYQNVYDQQGTDIYTNCMFDPIDDGNTEDDWFDPADPFRRLGPSSTCFPEFSFTFLGDTFQNSPFGENNIGNASDGPGLPGDAASGGAGIGPGTWVESKFSLERFRGRRLRVRFLETALKLGTTENWEAAFQNNPDPGDDGWWIDAVEVNNTLVTPAVITKDDDAAVVSTVCDTLCFTGGGAGAITADLVADPPGALPAPGQAVELSAVGSSGNCANGTLQYRFWRDDNFSGTVDLNDTLLRTWTDNAKITEAPSDSTAYLVEVRCSSDPSVCVDTAALTVAVDCPTAATGDCVAALTANPPLLYGPGDIVLDASASTGTCAAGLEYEFWIDGDDDGMSGGVDDVLLRAFDPAPTLARTVFCSTDFLVNLDCPGATGFCNSEVCNDAAVLDFNVATCNTVSAALVAMPPALPAPGMVTLDASTSTLGVCPGGGVAEYEFWIDTNNDGIGGNLGDVLLQGFDVDATATHSPGDTTAYVVNVRCSTATCCTDSAKVTVPVDTCDTVTASLAANPPSLSGPGSVELDATGSTADNCAGVLEYRFWIDGDGNSTGGDPADTLLQPFAPTANVMDDALVTTRYVVDVRCSTDTSCDESDAVTVSVGTIFQAVGAPDKTSLSWQDPVNIEFVRGRLSRVRVYDVIGGGVAADATAIDISSDDPPPGDGFYYQIKEPGTSGGESNQWSSGGVGQVFDREVLLPEAGCSRPTPEVWTVNATTVRASVLDSCTELPLDVVDLMPGGGGNTPRALEFSTVDTKAGDFAFVTQGNLLRVIDTATRGIVSTVDVSALPEFPTTCSDTGIVCTGAPDCPTGTCNAVDSLTLKGADSARLQNFTVGAMPTVRPFLYVAADVGVIAAISQPWFIVIDQDALTQMPVGSPVVVQAGPLTVPDDTEALDVTAISTPGPPGQFQRAWFTVRDTASDPDRILSVLVATPRETSPANWSVQGAPKVTSLIGAQVAPDNLTIGAGISGELTLLPKGPLGTLEDLDAGMDVCEFGGVQRAVDITGPGSGAYRVYAVDQAANRVRRVEELDIDYGTCAGASEFDVGMTPVAIDAFGQQFSERAWVANRASDDVSIIRNDGTLDTITLAGGSGPTDIEAQINPDSACNVENVIINGNTVQWDTVGCDEEDQTFFIWCQCLEADPADCPASCPATPSCPGCKTIGADPWDPTGIAQKKGNPPLRAMTLSYTDPFAAGANVTYTVTINEREPLPLLP